MDELAGSAYLVNDPGGLRRRLAEDGYLFFRGLLSAGQPAPAELILEPNGRRPELFSRLFSCERWWEPVPAGLTLRPRAQMAGVPPGPSRLVAVHPGWKQWRAPSAAVH